TPSPPTVPCPLSLHDALPISLLRGVGEMLAPVLDPFDRTARELGGGDDRDVLRVDAEFRPEAAAHVGRRDAQLCLVEIETPDVGDRKSTRLNSSHVEISYAVF